MKTDVTEQLTDCAKDLASEVGGNQLVEVWAWVILSPGEPPRITCKCCVGETAEELATGYSGSLNIAFMKCMEAWRKAGSPTGQEAVKLARLKAEADKLGYE